MTKSHPLTITSRDRVLIFAPHPDDESLAAGGLIQRAVAVGAEVRAVFATDGDNNPWPQRFIERRWNIGKKERARWGRMRREEALLALAVLGVSPDDGAFYGLPDQGLTRLLQRGPQKIVTRIRREIMRFAPTILVVPSLADRHPDHSAFAVMIQLALDGLDGPSPQVLHCLVHTGTSVRMRAPVALMLSNDEIATKRDAILCHESQVLLSRSRFLSHARKMERFDSAHAPEHGPQHPVKSLRISGPTLHIGLRRKMKTPLDSRNLQVLLVQTGGTTVFWSAKLPSADAVLDFSAENGIRLPRRGTARVTRDTMTLQLRLGCVPEVRRIYVKLENRRLLYDPSGWIEVGTGRGHSVIPSNAATSRKNVLL